jgi:hypothetical protein
VKRIIVTLAAVASLFIAGASPVAAASDQAGQCPGYNDPANTKVDTDNDDLVLEAGLTICIHASNGNTGEIITDGTTTLGEYIEQSGLLNNGGQVPGVSNYVVYGTVTTTTTDDTTTTTTDETTTTTTTDETTTTTDETVTTTTTGTVVTTTTASTRKPTPPPTDTIGSTGQSSGSPTALLLVLAGLSSIVLVVVSTYARVRR